METRAKLTPEQKIQIALKARNLKRLEELQKKNGQKKLRSPVDTTRAYSTQPVNASSEMFQIYRSDHEITMPY